MAELTKPIHHYDHVQQPIRIGITMDLDGNISGPRSLVKPVARVGGRCLERRCELNIDGRCGSGGRRLCPEVER